MIEDGDLVHNYDHACDRSPWWSGGPGARHALLRRMELVTRNQRDREARAFGYVDLGGEG